MRGLGLVVAVSLWGCSTPASQPWNELPSAARVDLQAAEAALAEAQLLDPRSEPRRDRLTDAARLLERVLEVSPHYFRARYLHQKTLLELDPASAAREYPVFDVPDDPAALTLAAAMLLPQAAQRAAWMLERATGLDPGFAWAWYGLAFVERRRGNHARSLEAAERATDLLSGFPEALDLLGRIQESLGLRREVAETFERLLLVRPDDLQLRHRLARLLLQSDDPSECLQAEQELRRVLRQLPEPLPVFQEELATSVRIDLGLALYLQGRLEEAAAQYRTILESQPDALDAWYNLGFVLERLERDREALKAYEQYVSHWHQTEGVTASQVRDRFSQVPDAIGRLRQRLGLDPENGDEQPDPAAPESDGATEEGGEA